MTDNGLPIKRLDGSVRASCFSSCWLLEEPGALFLGQCLRRSSPPRFVLRAVLLARCLTGAITLSSYVPSFHSKGFISNDLDRDWSHLRWFRISSSALMSSFAASVLFPSCGFISLSRRRRVVPWSKWIRCSMTKHRLKKLKDGQQLWLVSKKSRILRDYHRAEWRTRFIWIYGSMGLCYQPMNIVFSEYTHNFIFDKQMGGA